MNDILRMNITEHFTFAEFEASDTAIRLDIRNVIDTFAKRDSVVALTREVLEPLRQAYGKPMHINSGYRCPELNRAVGGSSTSQHMKGEAADIRTGSQTESWRLAKLAKDLRLPYDQMILYPTFVHFSHRLSGEQRRAVMYSGDYKGRKV